MNQLYRGVSSKKWLLCFFHLPDPNTPCLIWKFCGISLKRPLYCSIRVDYSLLVFLYSILVFFLDLYFYILGVLANVGRPKPEFFLLG